MPEPGDNGKTFIKQTDRAFYSQPQYEILDEEAKRRVLRQFKSIVEAGEIREAGKAIEGNKAG